MKKQLQTMYYAGAAFLSCWAILIPSQLADPDLWGRLSVAALWSTQGKFPYADVFSFTAYHHVWVDHEWLSGVLFYAALWLGGEVGLHLLKYGLILAVFYGLFSFYQRILQTPNRLPLMFALLFLLFPLYGNAFYPTIRSQLFSFVCFIAFLTGLERVRQQQCSPTQTRNVLTLLSILGILWANAHGGFILGLVLFGLYGLGVALEHRQLQAARPYWMAGLGMMLGISVLNPYGLSYWPFIFHALTMPRPYIPEWNPLPLLSWEAWDTKLLILGSLIAFLATVWKQRQAINAPEQRPGLITPALVLLFFMGLAVKGIRFNSFLALTVLVYAPICLNAWQTNHLANPSPASPHRKSLLPLIPGLAATGACLSALLFYQPHYYFHTIVQDGAIARERGLIPFPIGALNYLKASPYQGNLINPFTWGEFLAWTLYPRFKVAWDGRYEEVYTNTEFAPLIEIYALPHPHNPNRWMTQVNHSQGDFMLIEQLSPNFGLMPYNTEWTLLYTDGFYALYGRKTVLHGHPAFQPATSPRSKDIYTIEDFFQPGDLSRFKT